MPVNKMKFFDRIITTVLLVANLVAVFLLLFSVVSPKINPTVTVYPAFIGISFPFWVLLNILFVLLWLLRWKKIIFISLIGLLLSSSQIFNYFPLHGKISDVPESSIKFLTYNCMGLQDAISNKDSADNIITYLKESKADIICLQEYSYRLGGWFTEDYIRKKLSEYPYYRYVPHKGQTKRIHGIACFSKHPIVKMERIDFKSVYNQSAAFTIRFPGNKEVVVLNNHLESNSFDSEDKLNYNKAVSNLNLKFFWMNRTLFRKMAKAYRIRSVQADTIRKYIDKQDKPLIVCGDFNDTPVSYAYYKIRGNLKDAFASTGLGMGVTFNRDRFYFRIDHILYDKSLKAYNCTVDRVFYSDHYPVSCYFDFK